MNEFLKAMKVAKNSQTDTLREWETQADFEEGRRSSCSDAMKALDRKSSAPQPARLPRHRQSLPLPLP